MTVADLLTNNTSASSVFPGWPNGLPPSRPVSKLPMNVPQTIRMIHICPWWGGTNHPNIGVNSLDPVYIKQFITDMKERGYNCISIDWYGQGSTEDKATILMKTECEAQGMNFLICIDGGNHLLDEKTLTPAQLTTNLKAVFSYISKNYYTSPAYQKINGRPVVQFFGVTGVDWLAVRAYAPSALWFFRWELDYGFRSYADGYFGWTHCDENWLTKVKASGKLITLGANASFNNTISAEPVRCTWGVTHPTILASEGGMRWVRALALLKAHPEIVSFMGATWNDYQEGSAMELGMATGFTPVLSLDKDDLMVQPLPPQFDHYALYLVNPDSSLRLLDTIASPTTKALMLSNYQLPYGSYTFYLHAVGLNSIQNVLSSPLTATLGWS
jgi:hypothetical protein